MNDMSKIPKVPRPNENAFGKTDKMTHQAMFKMLFNGWSPSLDKIKAIYPNSKNNENS